MISRTPVEAIAARRSAAEAKVDSVAKALTRMARQRVPITAAELERRSGVSRSFLYQNADARTLLEDARSRTEVRNHSAITETIDRDELAFRERALNAEDRVGALQTEIIKQRQQIALLLGQLKSSDGTWLLEEVERLTEQLQERHGENHSLRRELDEALRKLESSRTNVRRLQQQRLEAVDVEADSSTPEPRRATERADGTMTPLQPRRGDRNLHDGSQP